MYYGIIFGLGIDDCDILVVVSCSILLRLVSVLVSVQPYYYIGACQPHCDIRGYASHSVILLSNRARGQRLNKYLVHLRMA